MTANRQRSAGLLAFALFLIAAIMTVYTGNQWRLNGGLNLGIVTAGLGVFMVITGSTVFLTYRKLVDLATWMLLVAQSSLFILITILVSDIAPILAITALFITALFALLALRPGRPAGILISLGVVTGLALLGIDFALDAAITWPRLAPEITLTRYLLPGLLIGLTIFGASLLFTRMRESSLTVKILATMAGITVIPVFVASVINNTQTDLAVRDSVSLNLYTSALQSASSVDNFVDSNLSAVSAEARLSTLRDYILLPDSLRAGGKDQILSTLNSWQRAPLAGVETSEARPFVREFVVLDDQARQLIGTRTENARFLAPDMARVAIERNRSFAQGVFFESADARWLYFFAPVPGEDGRPVGALVALVDASWLDRLLQRNNELLGAGSQSWAMLYDENTQQLASGLPLPDDGPRFVVRPDPGTLLALQAEGRIASSQLTSADDFDELYQSLLRARQLPNQPSYYTGSIDTGVGTGRYLAALTPLRSLSSWTLAYVQPEVIALQTPRNQIRFLIAITLALVSIVAVATWWSARSLTRPLTALARVARRVSEGDLSARAEVSAPDERGQLASAFNAMTDRLQEALRELDQRVQRRTAQLQATAEISRLTAIIRDVPELLRQAVVLIQDRFGFYHVAVFMLDAQGAGLVLRDAAGVGAEPRLEHGQTFVIGSRSLVGWVGQRRQARIAYADSADSYFTPDPDLPEVKSILALPLAVGDRLLGVLKLYSREDDAFRPTDQQALQTLADQISVTIENAESFQRTQQALADVRSLYQRTLNQGWQSWAEGQPREQVLELRPGPGAGGPIIQVPIRMRDEIVGTIELELPEGAAPLTPQETAALETAAAQLATALESSALVHASQARSRREQMIIEITDQMRASLSPELILQNGIRHLGRALGGAEVTVRLNAPHWPAADAGSGDPSGD